MRRDPRRLPLATLAMLALAACRGPTQSQADAHGSTPRRVPDAPDGATPRPPGPSARASARADVRFFALGTRACLGSDARDAACGHPSEVRGEAGVRLALALRPLERSSSLVEAASRRECFRTKAGLAICDGQEIARGVKTVAGAPYLLHDDGSVSIAPDPDPVEAALDRFRAQAAKKLPALDQLVATEHATCGLGRTGEVWCWPEPAFPFDESLEEPVEATPKRVPGLSDVVDLTLMPWLTLCVRTKAGAVLCSSSEARTTDVCMLRGKREVRCGAASDGSVGGGRPSLAGEGYDPRRALERPLVPVPGVEGATTLGAYPRIAYQSRESQRRLVVSELDEGGCARLAAGGVRCWERDRCAPRPAWRSAGVEGLPQRFARLALGANDGYALTEEGALYTWPRRPGRGQPTCAKPAALSLRAERVPLKAPAMDVGGGTFVVEAEPMFAGVDCATLATGEVQCWHTDAASTEKVPITVTRPE